MQHEVNNHLQITYSHLLEMESLHVNKQLFLSLFWLRDGAAPYDDLKQHNLRKVLVIKTKQMYKRQPDALLAGVGTHTFCKAWCWYPRSLKSVILHEEPHLIKHLSDYMSQVTKCIDCNYSVIRLKGKDYKQLLENFSDNHRSTFLFLMIF